MRAIRFAWMTALGLILITAPAVAAPVDSFGVAKDGPVLEVTPSSSPEEQALFQALIEELAASRNSSLVQLAEKAQATLDAAQGQERDAFIAAEAVYDHYLKSLDTVAQEALRIALEAVHPDWDSAASRALGEINVINGCGAELSCANGSSVSCICTTPTGTCSHNKAANSWGGAVSCNCTGTPQTSACPSVPSPCPLPTPSYISGPDLCQGSIETYQTSTIANATNYRWEVVGTPIGRNTSGPIMSLSGHYFHNLGAGVYTLRVRAENSQCVSGWRPVNLVVRSNGDPLCTVCELGDRLCFE